MNNPDITYFAQTDSRSSRIPFGIKSKDRAKHTYIIGKTGMGKSTVLENMTIQDIQNGNGVAFLDPHGKTADLFLEYVPEHRKKDVIYFAPFDMDHPISFNVLEDVGPDKRHLVTSGLMSAFKKIWVDAWSARMEYILNNILLALLEYPGSTLIGVNRMLADKDYRKKVVDNIKDPSVKAFWVDEFAKYGDRYMQEAGASIQNKIGQFVSNPLVRNIIGQPKSTFDLRKIMDDKKILIINLSKGRMGETNANLIGSMLITKIYLAAMSRADSTESVLSKLPPFYLYVDEFQNFANESFADILSEARKYKLCLTVAHQYIEQMSDEVRAAVFGNVGTMITFRVGAYDAEVLEKEFAPQFTAEDLVNLGRFQIYLKLMIDEVSSSPFSATTLPQIEKPIISFTNEIIENSRAMYARPRPIVEQEIKDWHEDGVKRDETSGGGRGQTGERRSVSAGYGGGAPGAQSIAPRKFDRQAVPQNLAAKLPSMTTLAQNMRSEERQRVDRQSSGQMSTQGYSAQRTSGGSSSSSAGLPPRRMPTNDSPSVSEMAAVPQSVSLNHLKNPPQEKSANTQKVATPEHISELRNALKAFMKPGAPVEEVKQESVTAEKPTEDKKEEVLKEHNKETTHAHAAHKHSTEKKDDESVHHKKHTKEVPKEVLMEILGNEEQDSLNA